MKIAILSNHDKAGYLVHCLHERFELAEEVNRYDYEVLLVDTDHPEAPPAPAKYELVKAAAKRGIPVVLYPHGGPPDLDWDGIRDYDLQRLKIVRRDTPPVSLQLLHGEGHAEIYRRCGLGHRFESVGWMYGPVNPFPGSYIEPDSLLFAPIHPWADGQGILDWHKQCNRVAYSEFLKHPAEHKTVRIYGADEPNGVYERVDGVEYTQSDLSVVSSMLTVREHDAVISYGTLAYCALAMGKRVAMIYAFPPHTSDDGKVQAAHMEDYGEYSAYPAAINSETSLEQALQKDVSEWRDLFVGPQLDVDRVEHLIRSLRPSRAVRRALARVA